jgi:hypothetical protein
MKAKLFLLFFLGSLIIKAQTYSISPAKTVSFTAVLNNITIKDIYQVNTGNSTIAIVWEKISIAGTNDWQYSMCDLGTCHSDVPAGPTTMSTVAAGSSGFLGINVDPGNTPGSSVVKVLVYQSGFRPNADTLTWYISTPPVGIEEIFANAGIKIFPNPAINNLNIDIANSDLTNIMITDACGRMILNTSLISGLNSIDVSSLAKGFYMLNIQTKDKQFYKRIIKE